ncbi:MAG: ribosome maturation factor RimP [Synergistaceae bacterium]|jgi:ribosome maturation factor RimP|nr:ribosome maturation factor RimP [Synergistaceae bacterium]
MKESKKTSCLKGKLAEIVAQSGVECVGVDVAGSRSGTILRMYIDSPDGVGHLECERVSRAAAEYFDSCEDDNPWFSGKYFLEVSSPGIERQLFTPEQYVRFIGRNARLVTTDRKKIEGELAGCEDDIITIKMDDGSEERIAFENIKRGNLAFAIEKGERKGAGARRKGGKAKKER